MIYHQKLFASLLQIQILSYLLDDSYYSASYSIFLSLFADNFDLLIFCRVQQTQVEEGRNVDLKLLILN
ncbi:hypothetical protein HBA_0423 [Sodalis endosymbiont of Henestaris halophilus]|nr:hypothetical protein HBA_0423 [Sodalis endosymbiont of Henestaris halophilus]